MSTVDILDGKALPSGLLLVISVAYSPNIEYVRLK